MLRRPLASLAAAVLALGAPAVAAEIQLPYLLNLHGELCPVRYSPGALDRAAHVQKRLETLAVDFGRWGSQAYSFQGYVLGPEDWASARLGRDYGLTARSGARGIAAPAWGDEHSVGLWRALLGGDLPWGEGLPVRGTAEEAASLSLSDLLLQLDCARVFVEGERLLGDAPWIAPLLAHATALQLYTSHEATRLGEIGTVWQSLGRRGQPSLEACAVATLDAATELACGARFHDGARILVAKDQLKTVRALRKLAKKRGLSESTLVKAYPALGDWLAAGRGR